MNIPSGGLPGWPPVLNEAWAAAYLSLSQSTFRSAVVPSVPAIQLTPGRVGWLRVDLDRWLAKQAGRDAGSSSLPNPWDND
jgi:predicted DNA-binding transcriptional regulator AlpA